MEYAEITLKIEPVMPFSDILMYEMGEIGCESFVTTDDGFKAYIPSSDLNTDALNDILANAGECNIQYDINIIPDQNWNAVWESTHEPVLVDDFCWVYAPFHGTNANAKYNILIEPKMSFGTAHHATTYMMISLLRDEDITNKTVLDMGSGTAVLAILAEMRGAKYVEAIDNDEWAYNNALENIENNNCKNIKAILGDASALTADKKFQLIIANINRNILLRDMKHYIAVLEQGGTLLLSGFYEHDIPAIRQEAESNGMKFETYKERNEWVACKFTKQ
ncbi:MAG: 50S ribosomal protein L11 methyltransferase [Bacteroidales bacterium]|nr:50S ribosomal protein L11 methyltransferase [Bacteroidales bacterium]